MFVCGNRIASPGLDSYAAVTAIETHGNGQVVSGNQILNFYAGLNITGVDHVDDDYNIVVSNNIIDGAFTAIKLWSQPYLTHTDGYGLKGTVVQGNTIRLAGIYTARNPYYRGDGYSTEAGIVIVRKSLERWMWPA